jgi:hypothetical protein
MSTLNAPVPEYKILSISFSQKKSMELKFKSLTGIVQKLSNQNLQNFIY